MTTTMSGEPTIHVLRDPDEVSLAAAETIADRLRGAVDQRGRADWATTGGSAPTGIYRALSVAPLRGRVPWQAVHLWWGDDRYVPPDHKLSNVLPAESVLMNAAAQSGQSGEGSEADDVRLGIDPGARIPATNVHPIPMATAIGGQLGPAWAAARYDEELRRSGVATEDGWPIFDVVLLGIGPDGHLLSVFPGSAAFDEEQAWAVAVPAPNHVEPHVARVSLNPRILDHAREVLVVVHGEGKADVLGRIFSSDRDPRQIPAQLVRRPGVTWLIDDAAANRMPSR
jgi:6-phosphogluconolactonase